MADTPAPRRIYRHNGIGDELWFAEGDPVPEDVARQLGLIDPPAEKAQAVPPADKAVKQPPANKARTPRTKTKEK